MAAAFGKSQSGLAAIEFAFVLPLMLVIYLGIVELSQGLNASRKVDLVAHAMSDLTGQIMGDPTVVPVTSGSNVEASLCDSGTNGVCVASNDIGQVLAAGAALIAPLPVNDPNTGNPLLTITISEVNIQLINGVYRATVDWSIAYNGGTLRNGTGCTLNTYLNAADVAPVSPTSMPTSFTKSSTSTPTLGPVIVADVTYTYNLTTYNMIWSGGGNNTGLMATWLPSGTILMQRTSYSPVRNTYTNTIPTPALFNHIQAPTTATTWATSTTGATNVNCLGYLTPPLR